MNTWCKLVLDHQDAAESQQLYPLFLTSGEHLVKVFSKAEAAFPLFSVVPIQLSFSYSNINELLSCSNGQTHIVNGGVKQRDRAEQLSNHGKKY